MKKKTKHATNRTVSKLAPRILFTLAILALYRLGSTIPVPGIDTSLMSAIMSGSSVFAVLNMIGGGALERMSLFALGVSPYITASIIIELLSMDVVPALSEWRKGGNPGRNKLSNATRYLGLALAVLQAVGIVRGFDRQYSILVNPGISGYLFVIILLVAGTEMLCWLGDQITERGIGNGMSMIIFAGIVSNLPSQFTSAFTTLTSGANSTAVGILRFALYCVIYLVLILAVVIVENSERRIPISYSTRTNVMGGSQMTYLPLKINSASVIPVIFAASVITAPQIILSFINYGAYEKLADVLSFSKPLGLILYAALTFGFTFFYTDLIMDPEQIASNLKTNNGFIPNVRPGKDTENYIKGILHRITVFGATGLTILAVIPYLLPMLIPSLPSTMGIGGTSVILIVGIALATIKSLMTAGVADKYSYSTFTNTSTQQWYDSKIA